MCGGATAGDIARAIRHAIRIAGVEHVALGSDFDGAVQVPFDATGLVVLTDALIGAGLDDEAIRKVMGGNVHRLFAETLPAGDQISGAISSAALAAPSVSTAR